MIDWKARVSMTDQNLDGFDIDEKEKVREPNNDFLEETAAEVSAPAMGVQNRNAPMADRDERAYSPEVEESENREAREEAEAVGKGTGWVALALSIISLFIFPVLMGAAGIIVGFIARRRGIQGLGNWAIGIGIVSIAVNLFIAPFLI